MDNLYKSGCLLKKCLFFLIVLCAATAFADPQIQIEKVLQEKLPSRLSDPKIGIADKKVNQTAIALWKEVQSTGKVIRREKNDNLTRALYTQIQTHFEKVILDTLTAPFNQPNRQKVIWIFHTPLIATPLVSEGEVSATLVAQEILKEPDPLIIKTALSRVENIRDFLNKGGIIVQIFSKEQVHLRTKTQRDVFESLKKRYPTQIIELPIEANPYPVEHIGATYFIQKTDGHWLAMSYLGAQINCSQEMTKWGMWLQDGAKPNTLAQSRFNELMRFFTQAGLQKEMAKPTQHHPIDFSEIFSDFSHFSDNSKDALK